MEPYWNNCPYHEVYYEYYEQTVQVIDHGVSDSRSVESQQNEGGEEAAGGLYYNIPPLEENWNNQYTPMDHESFPVSRGRYVDRFVDSQTQTIVPETAEVGVGPTTCSSVAVGPDGPDEVNVEVVIGPMTLELATALASSVKKFHRILWSDWRCSKEDDENENEGSD